MLEINTLAKDFTLLDKDNNEVSLHDFKGKKVLLYFYPKDSTPGCTKEALAYKELFEEYQRRNIVVIGISKDSIKAHCNFANKYELPFILLSDPNHEVIEMYEAWVLKKLYGKESMGTLRCTYLIDEEGKIILAMEKVNVNTNAQDVLDYLDGLNK